MNKREANKLERKAKIISTAKVLFLERGLADVQMQEIAELSGIGLATLFRYFPSKREIVLTVANEFVQKLNEDIHKIVKTPLTAFEKMEALLDYFTIHTADEKMKLLRFQESFELFSSPQEGLIFNEEYIKTHEKFAGLLIDIVEQGKSDKTIRQDINTEVYIMTVIHSFSLFSMKLSLPPTHSFIPAVNNPSEQQQALKMMLLGAIKA